MAELNHLISVDAVLERFNYLDDENPEEAVSSGLECHAVVGGLKESE